MTTLQAPLKLTFMQVVEAFGPSIEVVYKEKRKEIINELLPVYDRTDRINASLYDEGTKIILHIFAEGMLTDREVMLINSLKYTRKVLKMTRMLGIGGRGSKKNIGMKVLPLEEVRQIPLSDYIEFKQRKRNMASCLFHEDATPSMKINSNNTVKCFSCGFFGDGIEITKKLYGFSFVDAVRHILGTRNETK